MTKSIWKYKTSSLIQTFSLHFIRACNFFCVFHFSPLCLRCFSVIGPAFPLCPWGGHCLHTLANWCKQATFERQSNVPNTDTQTHAHPSWKEVTLGYFDFIWLLSSPLMRLSASQPHTQHFSYDFTYRLGKITPLYTMSAKSGVPSSWFGHRWLKDMSYKERVCVVEEETKYIYEVLFD